MAIAHDELDNQYNILHKKNTTFSRVFTWTDAFGVLVDLTGFTGVMKVRKMYPKTLLVAAYSDAAVVEFSTNPPGNGKMVLGGTAGTITVTGTASDMNFAIGLYDYDVLITSGSNTYVVSEGTFELRAAASI